MSVPPLNTGRLLLVVGPSGVGKDSLLDGARAHFADDPTVIFSKRSITRPANAGGEVHTPISDVAFHAHVRNGDYALHWDAHDLYYGVPIAIDDDLQQGRSVVVNVSRAILGHARTTYGDLTVLSITTHPEILAERLRGRGRESEDDIQRRLARAQAMKPNGPDVIEIDNSGLLIEGIARFIDAISNAVLSPQR